MLTLSLITALGALVSSEASDTIRFVRYHMLSKVAIEIVERAHEPSGIRQTPDSGVVEQARSADVDFPAAAYASSAATDALLRWWFAHGRPATVRVGPGRSIQVERTGVDPIPGARAAQPFERIEITGLYWGRLITWIDRAGGLIAMIGGEIGLDRFEVIREDHAASLTSFAVRGLAADSAWLRRISAPLLSHRLKPLAIVDVDLIDGTGAAPLRRQTVIVRDGRVHVVGPVDSVTVPRNAKRLDGRGMTLLPGLWDMHGHYMQAEWLLAGLAAGVTSVRDAANEFPVIRSYRDWTEQDLVLGPRLFPAGVVGLGHINPETEAEARAAVQAYAAARFPQIKIYEVRPALVPVITDEARKHGMTVTGHVPGGMNVLEFLKAGATQVNHYFYVTGMLQDTTSAHVDSIMQLFRAVGLVLDPSLARIEQMRTPYERRADVEPGVACAPWALREQLGLGEIAESNAAVPAAARDSIAAVLTGPGFQQDLRLVTWLARQGVTVVLGTDQVVPGHSIHRELELAVVGGMSPLEAIRSATSLPARALGRPSPEGVVRVGSPADLLLVRGDPSTRISDVRRVVRVIRGGRALDPVPLWKAVGFRAPCP